MPARKTAIAIPEELLTAVDRMAKQRGESRSRFIQHALRAAIQRQRDDEITRRLNEVHGDPSVRADQLREARRFRAAKPLRDERW